MSASPRMSVFGQCLDVSKQVIDDLCFWFEFDKINSGLTVSKNPICGVTEEVNDCITAGDFAPQYRAFKFLECIIYSSVKSEQIYKTISIKQRTSELF